MDEDVPFLSDCLTFPARVTGIQETGAIFLLLRVHEVVIASLARSHRMVILVHCDIDKCERNTAMGMFLKSKNPWSALSWTAGILVNGATHSSAVG